jgi:hypothetical protein
VTGDRRPGYKGCPDRFRSGHPLSHVECRRRPTLPHPGRCSTIGAGGLSFRVRDGTGRSPLRHNHRQHNPTLHFFTSSSDRTHTPRTPGETRGWGGWLCAQGHTVDANNKNQQVYHQHGLLVWASPRPISTGRLHTSQCFHPRPINPIVSRGPYPRKVVGDLILERASRLDAFSGYPFRT